MSATFGQAAGPSAPAGTANLVYRHEPTLFGISATISILFWILLIVGTLGIALLYLLGAFVVYLFVQSALLSYLRGNGVRIDEHQLPDLHARLAACCDRLGIAPPPEAYLIHAGGAFNAFAARFLGRHFLALFSDVVDALDAIAKETGKTVPQIALNWLLQRPTVANVIVGARNEEQLRQNLGAVGWNLTPEQVAKLDAASTTTLAYPYWHQRGFAERNPPPVS